MNDEQLQKLTEEISLRFFRKPFRHKAFFNRRLRTVGGRYMLSSHNIEINYRYLEQYGIEEIIGIVKHELCHYHLHLEKKGYQHRDQDFKQLLREVGAPRFCTPLKKDNERKKTRRYVFQCQSCRATFVRRRNININKYVCGACRGRLHKVNEEETS